MRASPAFQITLRRFGVWRGAVAGLAASGALAASGWWVGRASSTDAVLIASLAVAGALWVALASASARVPPATLRWDGQHWHLGRAMSSDGAALAGELGVAIDLGPWMLLRFRPLAPGRRRTPTWLPVQRRGLEAQWHALRCAVYSPRPPPAADTPADF